MGLWVLLVVAFIDGVEATVVAVVAEMSVDGGGGGGGGDHDGDDGGHVYRCVRCCFYLL